jgi:hypothetical protein
VMQYSHQYHKLVVNRIAESINMWCYNYNGTNQCLYVLEEFFQNESYHITDVTTFNTLERDDRLNSKMIEPFQRCLLLQQFPTKCELPILQMVAEQIAKIIVDVILRTIWHQFTHDMDNESQITSPSRDVRCAPKKKFTDWGALLISKQSRMLQQYISTTMIQSSIATGTDPTNVTATKVIQLWERLSYVITILQLEKPMDWITYYHAQPSNNQSTSPKLTPDEVSETLHLRVDFSSEAIDAVVSKLRKGAWTH